MNTKLAAALSAESDGIHDPFRTTLSMLRNFFDGMVHDSRETLFFNQHVVVFFDTNPALTEYTKLALCKLRALQRTCMPAFACTYLAAQLSTADRLCPLPSHQPQAPLTGCSSR